jgi:protein gp37
MVPERLDQPIRWRKPRRIFVNSMSDLFHPGVGFDYIAHVFAVMSLAEQHSFQVLTKRPQRMAQVLSDDTFESLMWHYRGEYPHPDYDPPWPLPNVWLGTSIESDRYTFRANHLRATPAAIRFLSLEPLIGPLPSLDLTDMDWVIVGGESGPDARPMHPQWARDLRDLCLTHPCEGCDGGRRRHEMSRCPRDCGSVRLGDPWGGPGRRPVPFFFKQWGEHVPVAVEDDPGFAGGRAFNDPRGGRSAAVIREPGAPFRSGTTRTMEPGDETRGGMVMLDRDTIAVRVGKRAAGRELDGQTWNQYPGGAPR